MLNRIWWPDTFFANAKMAFFHKATTDNAFLRIKPSGFITQSLRYAQSRDLYRDPRDIGAMLTMGHVGQWVSTCDPLTSNILTGD